MAGGTSSRSRRVDFVKTLALAGGEAVRGVLPGSRVREKEGRGNFVTAAGEASERAILSLIAEVFPGDEAPAQQVTLGHPGVLRPLRAEVVSSAVGRGAPNQLR
jgi:hypothetical protein